MKPAGSPILRVTGQPPIPARRPPLFDVKAPGISFEDGTKGPIIESLISRVHEDHPLIMYALPLFRHGSPFIPIGSPQNISNGWKDKTTDLVPFERTILFFPSFYCGLEPSKAPTFTLRSSVHMSNHTRSLIDFNFNFFFF